MIPTFVEMFCGVGGFRLGLERSGWNCLWANDNDRYACEVYRRNFGSKELIEADIGTINARSVPDHDLLTAGFPCQSFSVAGKRKGFEDTRGTLFHDIARVVEAKRPPLLLLENVKGLLSAQDGYCFARILQTLDELGYWTEWQVLNSKHFGVPQNRERVFVVGHLGEAGGREIFPITETCEDLDGTHQEERNLIAKSVLIQSQGREPHIETRKDSVSHALKGKGGWEGNYVQVYDPKGIAPMLHKSGGRGTYLRQVGNLFSSGAADGRIYDASGISPSLRGFSFGWSKPKIAIADTLCDRWLMETQHHDKPMCEYRIRRLTPTESERLQGFPDGWTEGVSSTQRYKLLGNAVTVNVIEFLGKRLLESLING